MTLLLAHLVGDYVLQTNHVARVKTKSSFVCLFHALLYTLPFLVLSWTVYRSVVLAALVVIGVTHFVIDRWRLARMFLWVRNQCSPVLFRYSWREAGVYGEAPGEPSYIAFWTLVIVDNTFHLLINQAVWWWFYRG